MTEVQIFQLFGLTFFAIGVGMFSNPKFVRSISAELEKSTSNVFYGGLISLVIGYFLVSYHNVWKLDAGIILTIMGWVAVFKGMALLMMPKHTMKMYKGILKGKGHWVAYFVTGLGIAALYFGYFA